MPSYVIKFESRDKTFLTSYAEIMTSGPLFQNSLILRSPRVGNFADIIKIATIFIKETFGDSKNMIRIRNYVLKYNPYLYFLIKQIC